MYSVTPVSVPPVPYPGDEDVDLAIGILPDLGPGGFEVNLRIGGIGELLQDESIWSLSQNLLGLGHGSLHALRTGGEDKLRSKGPQQDAALHAHGVGHGQDQPVALHRGHERQGNSGVAAGGLDQHGLSRPDLARLLGRRNHADADAVLDAAVGIEALQLGGHRGPAACGYFVQLDQRGVSDQFRDVAGYLQGMTPYVIRSKLYPAAVSAALSSLAWLRSRASMVRSMRVWPSRAP